MATISQSLKIMLVSSGVLLIGLLVKSYVPINEGAVIWSSISSYLRPPYLYVIINFMILIIAASSRFPNEEGNSESEVVMGKMESAHYDGDDLEVSRDIVSNIEEKNDIEVDDEEEEEFVISKATWTPPRKRSVSPEKPLVSARFAQHRKPLRLALQGGRVSKPKRHETLENTWKAITEGRPMPLTRHLKRCDTWETHIGQENMSPLDPTLVKKSETFKDRTNYYPSTEVNSTPPSGKLRKEPSLSQDELNRRVEAFINKFNEEMRLQRQESLNQYKEMVGRGVY